MIKPPNFTKSDAVTQTDLTYRVCEMVYGIPFVEEMKKKNA